MVEVTGLEPTTFWSLTRRATKLRYTSKHIINYNLKHRKSKLFCHVFQNFFKIFKTVIKYLLT